VNSIQGEPIDTLFPVPLFGDLWKIAAKGIVVWFGDDVACGNLESHAEKILHVAGPIPYFHSKKYQDSSML
jgi:hypothetical protein